MIVGDRKIFYLALVGACAFSLAAHSERILKQNFDQHPTGAYTPQQLEKDFSVILWAQGLKESRALISVDDQKKNGKLLRIRYPLGQVASKKSGASWRTRLPKTFDQVFVSYRIKFEPEFNFVIGGKLPGLMGGNESTGLQKSDGQNGFSVRVMWQPNGFIGSYIYHTHQKGPWGDYFPWQLKSENLKVESNRWYQIRQQVKINGPQKSDGIIRVWVDGQLSFEKTDFNFRNTPKYAIDSFMFSSFFGGHTPEWAPTKDQWILFDDIELRTDAP